jgi:hypothetical protein
MSEIKDIAALLWKSQIRRKAKRRRVGFTAPSRGALNSVNSTVFDWLAQQSVMRIFRSSSNFSTCAEDVRGKRVAQFASFATPGANDASIRVFALTLCNLLNQIIKPAFGVNTPLVFGIQFLNVLGTSQQFDELSEPYVIIFNYSR